MNKLTGKLLGICLLLVLIGPAVHSQSLPAAQRNSLVEEFSFSLKDFKIDHQGEHNNLNISVSYRYVANVTKADYPDFRWLAKDVETLLSNYPNEDDYWEIVNKQLTSLLLKKYPALVSVTCELKVDPSQNVPYTRASRVTRERETVKLTRKRVST
jgi:hypothetical protein